MGQEAPHAPQLSELVWVLTQSPEQLVVPAGQTQTPVLQTVPPVHDTPHAPQLLESVWRFTQAPVHSVRVMLQCIWQ